MHLKLNSKCSALEFSRLTNLSPGSINFESGHRWEVCRRPPHLFLKEIAKQDIVIFSRAKLLKAEQKELAVLLSVRNLKQHREFFFSFYFKLASGLSHILQVWKLKYKISLKKLIWNSFLKNWWYRFQRFWVLKALWLGDFCRHRSTWCCFCAWYVYACYNS